MKQRPTAALEAAFLSHWAPFRPRRPGAAEYGTRRRGGSVIQAWHAALGVLALTVLAAGAPVHAELVSAVEFYHPAFRHFFLATSPTEMAKLDAGAFHGWKRAEFEFKVEDRAGQNLFPVCRFFSAAFGPRSTHFFTAFPDECETLKSDPAWTFEGIAFYARLPDASGSCPAGTMPVYRGYNNGAGGAPAHRFTPYRDDRCAYFWPPAGNGCTPEGAGRDGVAFCAPVFLELAEFRTQQFSGTWEFSYDEEGARRVVQLTFGPAIASYPVGLPPRYWPEVPYRTEAAGVAAGAGWDPIAGKMVVVYLATMLQFDFDGVNATGGCAYLKFEFFNDGRGPCEPLAARRL